MKRRAITIVCLAISAILVWFLCGYVAAGSWYVQFQYNAYSAESRERDRRLDSSGCLLWFLGGPLGLVAATATSGWFEHGIAWNWPVAPRLPGLRYEKSLSD